jgi:aminopeptidase N
MGRRTLGILCLALWVVVPAEAQRLPASVQPDHYDLAFDVDLAAARFGGLETIQIRLSESTRRIVLHAAEIEFESATITADGLSQQATVTLHEPTQTATLSVPRAVPAGPAAIAVRFRGTLNDDLRGFYLSRANDRRYAVTQFEATDARRAFPSFDEPAFKATFALALTIDENDTAISNGRMVSDTPAPPGRHTLTFERTPKMSTYLVAMAVGDFKCISDSVDSIPLRICATPGKESLGEVALDAAKQIVPFLNRYYSIRYPFGKLDLVAVPDFAAGAMENTAAIFYREVELLADPKTASVGQRKRIWTVLAHEMAHQWFGDLVTMRWWNDLWLNEGFATWMESRPLAALKPEWNIPVDQAAATQAAMNLDGLGTTRPIRANVESPGEIENSFDAITYEKSAAVLRMIEGWVGAEAFRRGVNSYLEKHSYANATAEDFWTALSAATGQPVDQVLSSFISRPGVPLVSVSGACGPGSRSSREITQRRLREQTSTSAYGDGLWQLPLCERTATGGPDCRVLAARSSTLACPADGWSFLNADARGYYRTEYPTATLGTIARDVQRTLTAPERLSLLGDEWALVRAGRHTASDYLTLAAGFGGERSSGVVDELTDHLEDLHGIAAAEDRPAFEQFVRTLLQPALGEFGFDARPDDSEERQEVRATLIRALGLIGRDEAIATQARAVVQQALAEGEPLEPTVASALVSVAASVGDEALWDALDRSARTAASPGERERYLFALARFSDPQLIDRSLKLALSDDIRSQDTLRFLSRLLANPSATTRTWEFVKRNWKELQSKLSVSYGGATLASGLANLCDPALRNDVQRFFKANPLPGGDRVLDPALERISACIAVRQKQGPAIARWLSTRK